MHKESLVVSPNKPRVVARTVHSKTEADVEAINQAVNIHARLPSADSGIQVDAGFDSLSRYRGHTFLSTYDKDRFGADTNDQLGVDVDRVGVGSATYSCNSSSGYSSDLSQGSLSLSPKVVPQPSRTAVAATKPVPPVKPNLTSSPSKSGSPRPTPRASSTAPSVNPPLAPETSNGNRVLIKTKQTLSTTCDTPPARCPAALRQPTTARQPADSFNQNVPTSKPVAAQRRDLGMSVTRRQPPQPVSFSDPPASDTENMLSNITTRNDVELSFSKGYVPVSSDTSAGQAISNQTATVLNLLSSGDSMPEVTSKRSSGNILSTPGATLNLQVLRPATLGRNQPEKITDQGQGRIALTRPLRLGAPSKLSVKTVQTTVLNPQPLHLEPVIKPSQHHEHKQQQHQMSMSTKPKPKIAPRPTAFTKASSSSVPVSSSCSSITTFSGTSSSSSSISTTASQPTPESFHNPEVPVVHRIKTSDLCSERTEIPVIHVVHRSSSQRNNNFTRPPSFVARHTPDRDKYVRQPIYENIRLNTARESLSFDDADSRMKHAELMLKHSDELISDAIKMLAASPPSPLGDNGSLSSSSRLNETSTHSEGTRQREHRIPIFDVRTGKIHSGVRKSYWSEWTAGHITSINEITWSERKERIDSALRWLRHELADLRDMDTRLISQFQRCQETIETLKNQREAWEGLSEEGEEGEYWEDYELNEYNRRYLDSPGGSSCSQYSPGSRQPSLQDVTLISIPVHQAGLNQDKIIANGQHGVTQDIEVTL